jgi:carotenoid cleavage dioxygenase
MRFEADIHDCEVIGNVPSDMAGSYVRVGPDWYFPPLHAEDGIIDADGYMNMYRF